LARRLIEDYPALANTDVYGPDAAAQLVHSGRLIPVLDGLDEMPPALHDAAIEALDRAVAEGGPLVVTCRSDEYQSAVAASGKFLSRAAVVEIEPVDVPGSIEFLTAPSRPVIPVGSPCLTTSAPIPTSRLCRRFPPANGLSGAHRLCRPHHQPRRTV
jgi:hypothetical protein